MQNQTSSHFRTLETTYKKNMSTVTGCVCVCVCVHARTHMYVCRELFWASTGQMFTLLATFQLFMIIQTELSCQNNVLTYPRHTVTDFNYWLIFSQIPHNTSTWVSWCQNMLHLLIPGQTCHIVRWLEKKQMNQHNNLILTWGTYYHTQTV